MTNKNNYTRRNLLQTGAALGAAVAMPAFVGARRACAADTGTLKIIPEVDLKILDPIWTTATVTSTHGLLIYDTLFATASSRSIPR